VYTVREIVSLLGLSTENQVRNRIEAIRDLLLPYLRRGPNNQLLLTEEGLHLLHDLQALCETGHTLKEAANILRFKAESDTTISKGQANKTDENRVKVEESEEDGWKALLGHLAEEVRDLAERVRILEARVLAKEGQMAWWERWRDLKIS
jgi:DNA-binding transcriptional MerR regulator